ncbi:hypothetical protein GF376_00345 [Candidatus Peregrinibacteria bacterium]|nr:hypothetical protein [Candidatus Peregrinibacteria bacterium]
MLPVLLHIEPITIYSLWVMLGLGMFVILLLINNLAKKRQVKIAFLANNSLAIFFTGIIFSRLFFIIKNYQYFILQFDFGKLLEMFYIWDKGLSAWGGLIGIFLSLFLLAKKEKANFVGWSDIIITSTFFGMFFFNIGTFLDGRNYGTPTTLPWGVIIESSQYAIPIHPVQIYAAIYTLLIGIVLFSIFNKKDFKNNGIISLIGIFCYSFFRFLEEFLRGDESFKILFLRDAQILAIIAMTISGYFIYKQYQQIKSPVSQN